MPFPRVRKFFRRLVRAFLAGIALFLLAVLLFAVRCHSLHKQLVPYVPTAERRAMTASVPDYHRTEDDTFLTYPEWYIVWSYKEKADYQREHLPGSFPYFSSIRQYWSGYCCSYATVRNHYPFNFGDHLMLAVIGTSFSVEYALKGAYESTAGRLSEWTSGGGAVEEDRYSYRVAEDYAKFVHIRPFYEFDFANSLKGLWKETHFWGPHPVRKWERKIWLSLDYGIEAIYCGLIELASHSVYGVESTTTYAWIENAPAQIFVENASVKQVKPTGADAYIVTIPRYQEFTDVAQRLSASGVRFVEIAGNGQILLTAIVPRAWTFDLPAGELLFETDILTDAASKRAAIRVLVADLHSVLNDLSNRGYKLEHVYDY